MRKTSTLLVASLVAIAAPATAQSSGQANCVAGYASSAGGMPPFVSALVAGFGRLFGYFVSNQCDVPED